MDKKRQRNVKKYQTFFPTVVQFGMLSLLLYASWYDAGVVTFRFAVAKQRFFLVDGTRKNYFPYLFCRVRREKNEFE